MSQIMKAFLIAGLMTVAPAAVIAQDDVITLEGTLIRGNQEAPLVLYLVPWKPPEARSLNRPDEELMLQQPLRPLNRSEFRRLLDYHQHFQQTLNHAQSEPE